MKSYNFQFQSSFFKCLLWMLFFTAASALTWNCKKECINHDSVVPILERPYPAEQVDPFDVISFVDPLENIMYIDPEYLPVVMDRLEALALSPEDYLLRGSSFAGDPVEFQVHVVYMPVPNIAEMADIRMEMLNADPDVVISGVDPNTAVPIRVRRNMKCGKTWSAFTSNCWDNDDGTSSHIQYMNATTCEKKDGSLCPEEYGIWGLTYHYSTKGCGGTPYKVEPERQWLCKG